MGSSSERDAVAGQDTDLLRPDEGADPIELTVFPAILVLATLVGIVPGLTAYRTDVADALAH